MPLKHVGRLAKNKKSVVVAYRTIPNDVENCLVVMTESLPSDEHDALMRLVESPAGQTSNELAEAMARDTLPDGRNMLAAFHSTGRLNKFPTNEIEMVPDRSTSIMLDELNRIIAEQQGVALDDIAIKPEFKEAKTQAAPADDYVQEPVAQQTSAPADSVLSDEDLAASYRSQADRLFKEAKALREQAEELVPTKKKKTTTSA
jgi:hypothetical protein